MPTDRPWRYAAPAPRRRTVLLAALLGGWLAPFRALADAIGLIAPAAEPLDLVGPWLDTLLPGDESPSATALGIEEEFMAHFRAPGNGLALLADGERWLESEAQRRWATSFAALPVDRREAIAASAASAEAGTLPRVFFDATWGVAVVDYYARRETWAALGYDGPPQPRGFPDQDRPPA